MDGSKTDTAQREVFVQQYMQLICREGAFAKWDCQYGGGNGLVTSCGLWPGMLVFLNDCRMEQFPSQILQDYHLLKINYCLEGRCEVRLRNHRYVYLQPGVVDVDINQEGAMFFFPGERYLGLEYVLDLQEMPAQTRALLETFGIDLPEEYAALKDIGGSRLGLPASQTTRTLAQAAALLQQPPEPRIQQELRVLTVRILADLCRDRRILPEQRSLYLTRRQRQMVLDVHREIQAGGKADSIEALAQKHHTSASSLENYFKAMYGESISRYRKKLRMQEAKHLLQTQKELSVREIALRCGYAHPGKFAQAFKQETGQPPHVFRRDM